MPHSSVAWGATPKVNASESAAIRNTMMLARSDGQEERQQKRSSMARYR